MFEVKARCQAVSQETFALGRTFQDLAREARTRSLRTFRDIWALHNNKVWLFEMSWVDRTKFLYYLTTCLSLTILFLPREALAACVGTTGPVTCTGSITSTVGTGPNSSITTLNIAPGASVNTSGLSVSMGSGVSASDPNIINVDGLLQSVGGSKGPWNAGKNVIEFGDYTVVNISSTGSIIQKNAAADVGGISANGGGNVVNNYGTLRSGWGAIFFAETNDSPTNTVANVINNYGTMTSSDKGMGEVIATGVASPIYFTNFEGGVVNGNIFLHPSSNIVSIVTMYNGSTFNGIIHGGGEPSILNLTGSSGSNTLSNAISLFGTLNKSGAGTWVVNMPSTLSSLSSNLRVNVNGGTLIFAANESSSQTHVSINEGGMLQLGQGGKTGWIDNVSVNNGTLAFDRSDNNSYTNNISGSGAVTQSGTGTTTLTANNSFTGATSISDGTLALSGAGAVAASSGVHNNGTFDVSGTSSSTPSIQSLDGNGGTVLGQNTLTITNANTSFGNDYAGVMSGMGGLTISGGTQGLSGQNSYSGATNVDSDAGLTLSGSIAGLLTNMGTTDVNGGTVNGTTINAGILTGEGASFQAVSNNGGSVNLGNSQAGAITNAQNATFTARGGTIASASNAGTMTLNNGQNVTGNVTNNGTLTLDRASIGGTLAAESGQFTVTSNNASANSLSGDSDATLDGILTLNNAQDTYAGVMSGVGGLAIAGGAETLTGNNTYSGQTSIGSGASMTLGTGGTSGMFGSDSNVVNNGTLAVKLSNDVTMNGVISGAGVFNQTGTGTTILNGNNTYTGTTIVSAGELQINGNQSGATGDTIVQSGARLTGRGTIGGNVSIADNAIMAPGVAQSDAGTLTINGNLNLSYNAIQNLDLGQVNVVGGQYAVGGQYNDLAIVAGDLVFSGTVNVRGTNVDDTDTPIPISNGLGRGIYRIYTYNGALSGANGSSTPNARLGTVDTAPDTQLLLQTSIDHEINLVVIDSVLPFWGGGSRVSPGGGGLPGNGTVNGGDGTWTTDNANWTDATGSIDNIWSSGTFAIFAEQAGTVTVRDTTANDTISNVTAEGMQFANRDGGIYRLTGDDIYAASSTMIMRVGDGTQQGSSITANLDTVINDRLVEGGTSLQKVDAGTLIISQDQTYRGNTLINGGTLQLGNGGTTGRLIASPAIVNDGSLTINFSNDNVISQPIRGQGSVTHAGTGTTTLRDSNSYSGGTFVANGTLKGTASSFGAGGINIGGNGSLIIDQASNASMSNSFSGSGAMSKIGSGNVTLNSNSPDFSGQVDVLAGGLRVDGNMSNARFNAQDFGTIYGAGSIGPTTVGNGGTLAPGGSGAVGTLSVNGELSMGAGSIFSATGTGQEVGTSVNVDGSSRNILASSFVNVSGNVSLAGGTAALNVASASILRVNQVYRLIEATGNISGRFDQLSTNIGSQYVFLDPSLFYSDKLVGVALNRNNTSFTILSRSRNEYASGAALDRLPSGNPLSLAVAGRDINDARSALNAASGEIHASAVAALIDDAFMLRETVAERLSSADCDGPDSSGSIQTAVLSEKSPSNRCHADRLVLWHQSYGSRGRNFGDGNAATMNHTSAGFLMGADVPVFSTARIGAMIGYSNDSFHVSSGRDSSGHSNNVTIGAYGGNHWGRVNLRLGANYTWNMLSVNRTVNFNGYNGAKLNAGYLSGTAQGFGEIGYRLRGQKIAFEPFAGLSYVSVHSGSFREKGSVEALEGRSFMKGVTFSTFGLRTSASYQMGKSMLMPRLMIGYRHSFGSLAPKAPMSFAASDDAAMRIAGTPLASDVAVLDAGFSLRVTDQIDVGLFYLGQYGIKATDSGLKGSLRVTF